MNKIDISIVIPNWNGAFLLRKNLPKVVSAMRNKKNRIIEIIVVDDYSSDDSVSLLENNFADSVRLVKHQKNQRFAAAVNTGVRFSKGSHICLLNTDVIPSVDFLESVVSLLKDESVFGVTLHEQGYGAAGGTFNGYLNHYGKPESKYVENTLWISGGSGVFSKEKWQELHGLDAELFSPFYWEDLDLGYRAQKRGYKLLWDPNAKVVHKHESVTNPKNFGKGYLSLIKERNELLFLWKNITSRNLFAKHKKAVVERMLRHPGYTKVVIAALAKWSLVMSRRAREKSESKVSDEMVYEKFSS